MLEVQKYLQTHTLKQLEDDFAVASKVNPNDTRVILDYDMIKSPKAHEIVRECRGLVLDSKDWSIVAKPFRRFFNAGEYQTDDRKFNWDAEVLCTTKEDGSLILLYNYKGKWYVNTRFSWADSLVNDSVYTWTNLVKMGFNFDKANLNPEYTYIMECCSLFNKVVRHYTGVQIFLLSVFHGETELTWDATKSIAIELGLETPKTAECRDIMDVQAVLAQEADKDTTFEGFVVRDCFNNRLKVKSPYYLILHKKFSNKVLTDELLWNIIHDDGGSEWLAYFPYDSEKITNMKNRIDLLHNAIRKSYLKIQEIKSQKEFANLAIKTPYASALFGMRKGESLQLIISKNSKKYLPLLPN